ncbi:MAG: cofactor-independent phosphoglycerate mutase [Sedimentisphaerales bacterium]|nr:cofactor-independent phosphoglycerate mutase [Sedimentisphaerales bacterium]
MKYAIVVMDGAADEPLAELEGKTPLEAAHIPHTDWIARNGRLGLVQTIPDGFEPGSDVALMSVLGYDPQKYHTGRAPLEAASQDIPVAPSDWVFRCNLVTVADGVMVDYAAGHIETVQAGTLIERLNRQMACPEYRFYPGVSYRHLLVHQGTMDFDVKLTAPHDIIDEPVAKYLPRSKSGRHLCQIMEEAGRILSQEDINQVRIDLGENQANAIWLWGQGRRPTLDRFESRFGLRGAVITAVDLLRGIGKLAGMEIVPVAGATGYLDTDYHQKGQAALEVLARGDLVFVHVEAPDEAGHQALIAEKIEAIEQIDRHIVGPLLKWLQNQPQWRIMVLPDHPTPIRLRTHTAKPVPMALAGRQIHPGGSLGFNETQARQAGFHIDRGHELMDYFLHVQA